MTSTQTAAYDAFVAADNAWQAELVSLFGKEACNIRYTEQGRTPLHKARAEAHAAWLDTLPAISKP